MKKFILFFFIIFPLFVNAHQDREFIYVYDNVTVRFRTGSYYEEINNAKIIGKYAALLSDSLNYNKPIFIDLIHDYGNYYQGKTYSYLNFGSDQYKGIVHYKKVYESFVSDYSLETIPISEYKDDTLHYVKEEYIIDEIDHKEKIVLRQFGIHFDITQTMNLLYFAIVNKPQLPNLTIQDTLSTIVEGSYYILNSIPQFLIDSLKHTTPKSVEKILQKRIYLDLEQINNNPRFSYSGNIIFFDDSYFYGSYFSQNGKMMPFICLDETEIILDTLNQIYAINTLFNRENIVFISETPYTFRMYKDFNNSNSEFYKSGIQTIPIDHSIILSSIDVISLDYDLYLISLIRSIDRSPIKKLLYLSEDDLLIDSFDTYIDSYRKKEPE